MARHGGHAAGGEGKGEEDVGDGIDEHVPGGTVDAMVRGGTGAGIEDGGQLPAKIDEDDDVYQDGAEFNGEDPDVVQPKSLCFVVGRYPALQCVSEYTDWCSIPLTHAPAAVKYLDP